MRKIILIILTVLVVLLVYNKISNNELIIPNNSIRVRVIPNSNNPLDISMKNKVKDYIKEEILPLVGNSSNIEEAREIISNNLETLDKNINNIFLDNNYKEDYNINFGYNYFPKKIFNSSEYPEGYYESLVVSIGSSKGDNWWCVMYPNICMIDKNKEYKSYFKELIHKYSKKKNS